MRSGNRTARSAGFFMLGVLVPVLLLGGTAHAKSWCSPGQAGNSCIDYNPRGGFDVTILSGGTATTKHVDQSFSLILANGYGDIYFLNLMRNRANYQAYRGYCKYRGFALSDCSTTGEVVLMRIKATPSMPEHFSLVSTSLRWGTTQYFLNDVFRHLNMEVMAGYENWYPFDLSCSVAMYIVQGGFSE